MIYRCSPRRWRRAGFTLVELLVVIGIIGLLISILLPSLQKARRAANSIACASNIRSILQAMHVYAAQNNGSIPGSAWTTSQFMFKDVASGTLAPGLGNTNLPGLIDSWDWAAPVLRIMGARFDEGKGGANRIARFNFYRQHKALRCPENTFVSPPFVAFGTPPNELKADLAFSYNTALLFLVQKPKGPVYNGFSTPPVSLITLPASYNVKLSKVGQGATKIYIADGSRYTDNDDGPDFDFSFSAGYGGPFADQGAWSAFSKSWYRGSTQLKLPRDCRIFAYRHGAQRQFLVADAYKANFGFFDGHVELLGDLESANPAFWMPKGTRVSSAGTEMWKDVFARYASSKDPYDAP